MTLQDEAGQPIYVVRPSDETQPTTGAQDASPAGQNSSLLGTLGPTLLFVFGMLVLIAVLFRLLRKNMARPRPDALATPRERIESIRSEAGSRSLVETYSAEAEELTRRLSAILDNKAARLELLIEEADQRLAKLAQSGLGSGVRTRPHEPEAHAFRPSPPPIETMDPTHRRICELADEGLDPVQIAKRLEQPIGQVELVLNLHKRRA
ncbi:MAG: hypothetical protein R3B57_10360 [Phycisphaerales bacterium]